MKALYSPIFAPEILVVLTLALMSGMKAHALPLERKSNTTLQMPQTPPAFGYQFTNAFPGVTFTQPMAIVAAPGETNRLYIVERAGRIAVITNLAVPNRTVFLDISSKVVTTNDCGLQAMQFHPGFATNGYFYVFYTGLDTTTGNPANRLHDILARYTASPPNANSASAATEQKLLRQYDRSGDHNGADIHFGPDGYLYLSLGDEGSPGPGRDYWTNSQYIDRNFFSALLRIDVDQKPGNLPPNSHSAVVAGTYRIPADNPFVGVTRFNGLTVNSNNVRTEFWAVGLRNPFRFSFDVESGRLYLGDVGQAAYEEINLITRGGNYGWIFREGAHPISPPVARSVPPGFTNYIDPLYEYASGTGPTQGKTVIGGLVYRGHRISQLYGHYVFGDHINNKVWSFKYDGTNVSNFKNLANLDSIVGFGIDPRDGDVLAANIFNGTVYRLIYNTNSVTGTPLPPTLAATGAFTNLATLAPNPGIVSYDLNVPFWSDHAIKSRWVSVPNTNRTIGFNPTNNWLFPTGTVWIKHFDLELTNGVPASAKRLETRFIVKNAEGVYGVTYRWGSSLTNATLVPEEGMDENFVIRNGSGGIVRTQIWHYPSRVECLTCHTPAGGFALGFNTPQMNRAHNYAGTITNQIQALSDAGYFNASVTGIGSLQALAHAADTSASVEFRVRSYFAANCVQCHQPGGVPFQQANWDARITTPLASAGIVDGALVQNFGNPNNRVVKFGSLTNSIMHFRVASPGDAHMPPLATAVINTQAVELLTAWITLPPAVNIVDVSPSPDENFQFTLSGTLGWTNIIQATTNLTTPVWLALATNVFDATGSFIFVDTSATNYRVRFYRAITP